MGKLIAIDGLDGSGKQTQWEKLADYLKSKGLRVRLLDFPVYESESSALVRLYLSGGLGSSPDDTNAYAASMFFAADRYISFVQDWRADHLAPDTVLLANRYTTANAIHQLSKLPRESWKDFLSWLTDFEFSKLGLPYPDLVLFLKLAPEISSRLIARRSAETGRKMDIHELDRGFLERSYEAGQYAADALGWVTVNCANSANDTIRTREDIFAEIKDHVARLLGIC